MRKILTIGVATLILTACSGNDDTADPPASIATSTTTTTTAPTTTAPPTTEEAPTATSTIVAPTTTSAPTTTAAPTTTTTAPGPGGMSISSTGIGPLVFGSSPEPSIEFLEGALGPATDDSGWGPSFSVFGTCPGSEVRGVTFGPLVVLFGDPEGVRTFYGWRYSAFGSADTFGLTTPADIGLSSSIADVIAAHPGTVIHPADEITHVRTAFFGDLFATFDDDDIVQYLSGGLPCAD